MQRWMTTCTVLALAMGCKGKEATSTAQPEPAAQSPTSTAAGTPTSAGTTAPALKRAASAPALTAGGADAASGEYLGEPLRTGDWQCGGEHCSTREGNTTDNRYSVSFAPAGDGSLHIVAFETYRWTGCPC